ncbi:hypothetical protein [Helicobacter pylori]|uniref:hypothetical protein n=1 Tax=Helicobacter pylori TaxID=210 RepID=UPI0012E89A48|nr:hypothetical protein [Helicobacter pylori]MUU63049.1 hypothetical protein [Helicobacter pylori]WQV75204.1 hypothetical protein KVJ71_02710 [Helicobacter pylori]
MMFFIFFTNYVKYPLFSKMIASGEKFGFVLIERWLSNLKSIAFLRLDSREIDFIKRYFLKRSLGGILVVGGNYFKTPLISLRKWI